MNIVKERIKAGIVSDNPIFVQVLGMCPTLAVTSSAINGVGMGLSTTVVLVGSNMVISMLRKIIPAKVRIPAFIVVIASAGLYSQPLFFTGLIYPTDRS